MKVIIACLNSKYVHASLSPWCLLAGVRAFSKKVYDVSKGLNLIYNGKAIYYDKNKMVPQYGTKTEANL